MSKTANGGEEPNRQGWKDQLAPHLEGPVPVDPMQNVGQTGQQINTGDVQATYIVFINENGQQQTTELNGQQFRAMLDGMIMTGRAIGQQEVTDAKAEEIMRKMEELGRTLAIQDAHIQTSLNILKKRFAENHEERIAKLENQMAELSYYLPEPEAEEQPVEVEQRRQNKSERRGLGGRFISWLLGC